MKGDGVSDGLDDLAHDNFACFVHERVSNAIGHMDAKASIMLGLTSGALIYLAGEFDIVTQWMALPSGVLLDSLGVVSVMALIASVLLASSFMLSVSWCVAAQRAAEKQLAVLQCNFSVPQRGRLCWRRHRHPGGRPGECGAR